MWKPQTAFNLSTVIDKPPKNDEPDPVTAPSFKKDMLSGTLAYLRPVNNQNISVSNYSFHKTMRKTSRSPNKSSAKQSKRKSGSKRKQDAQSPASDSGLLDLS